MNIKLRRNFNKDIFSIFPIINKNLFISKTSTNDIVLSAKSNQANQKWYLVYDSSKNAYLILSNEERSMALTLEYPSLKLIVKDLNHLDNQYWFIQTQIDSESFVLINYKNPNLCMSISQDNSISMTTINTLDNIKFGFKNLIVDEIDQKNITLKNKLSDLYLKSTENNIILDSYNNNMSDLYAWSFECVDGVFGIFKIKSKNSNRYLNCPDQSNLNLISKELTDTQSAMWKVYFGGKNVIVLKNMANSNYLFCNENKQLLLLNDQNSGGAGRFWGTSEV